MNRRITELRKALSLTMEAFGQKLGVTKSSISNIESGRRKLTEQMILSICREFGVNEEWLRNGTGGPDDMFVSKMNERIRQIRRELCLTQAEFASRIGSVQNTITGYESGRRNPSAPVISLICKEFGVNEEWLRNGTGGPSNMFVPESLNGLESLAKRYNLSIADQLFIEKYVSMKPSSRRAIIDFVVNVAAALDDADTNGKQENIYADIPDTPEELEQKYLLKDHEKGGGLG